FRDQPPHGPGARPHHPPARTAAGHRGDSVGARAGGSYSLHWWTWFLRRWPQMLTAPGGGAPARRSRQVGWHTRGRWWRANAVLASVVLDRRLPSRALVTPGVWPRGDVPRAERAV